MKVSLPFNRLRTNAMSYLKTKIQSTCTTLPDGWSMLAESEDNQGSIKFCYNKLVNKKHSLYQTVSVLPDLTYKITCDHSSINPEIGLPNTINNEETVLHVLKSIGSMKICEGNSDPTFIEIINIRGGKLMDKQGK